MERTHRWLLFLCLAIPRSAFGFYTHKDVGPRAMIPQLPSFLDLLVFDQFFLPWPPPSPALRGTTFAALKNFVHISALFTALPTVA